MSRPQITYTVAAAAAMAILALSIWGLGSAGNQPVSANGEPIPAASGDRPSNMIGLFRWRD